MAKSVEHGITNPKASFDKVSLKKGSKVNSTDGNKKETSVKFKNMWGE